MKNTENTNQYIVINSEEQLKEELIKGCSMTCNCLLNMSKLTCSNKGTSMIFDVMEGNRLFENGTTIETGSNNTKTSLFTL